MTIPLTPKSLVEIIDTIDETNNQSALITWSNNKYSKTKTYQDYYPIIIKTTKKQIELAKDICHSHGINLNRILLDFFMKITQKSLIEKLIKKQNENNINKNNSKYKKQSLIISINNPAMYQNALLSTIPKEYPTKKEKQDFKNETDQIKSNSHKQLKQEIKEMKKYKKENYKKYLIIFYINELYNYKYLANLNYELNKNNIANIDDIFAKIIYYLTLNSEEQSFKFQYIINNDANLTQYKNWLENNNN